MTTIALMIEIQQTASFVLAAVFVYAAAAEGSSSGAARIDSFLPGVAKPGELVTITGENFASFPGDNHVRFGAVTGTVASATTTSLEVVVPVGATFGPIAVSMADGRMAVVAGEHPPRARKGKASLRRKRSFLAGMRLKTGGVRRRTGG